MSGTKDPAGMGVPPTYVRRTPLTVLAGGLRLTAVFDGLLKSAFDAYRHVGAAQLRQALGPMANEDAPWTDSNCFVVESAGSLGLIDAGSGVHLDHTAGALSNHLTDMGIAPGDIDYVIMTHLHGDHVGGLINPDGSRIFPRAVMHLHTEEAEYWRNAPSGVAGEHHPADLTGMALRAYSDGAATFEDGREILPGVKAIHLPGHTPGHSGFFIGEGPDAVFIWGDVIHLPEVQFARPDITTVYDLDVVRAEESRRKALTMACEARLKVAGMHLRQPPFGRVVRHRNAFAFTADEIGAAPRVP
ncbi:Beta-lactamase domain protein precursor [Devosia sp. LC5]|nr:Beta-lactamase domain protein precursor [Devosia sp. LC5]